MSHEPSATNRTEVGPVQASTMGPVEKSAPTRPARGSTRSRPRSPERKEVGLKTPSDGPRESQQPRSSRPRAASVAAAACLTRSASTATPAWPCRKPNAESRPRKLSLPQRSLPEPGDGASRAERPYPTASASTATDASSSTKPTSAACAAHASDAPGLSQTASASTATNVSPQLLEVTFRWRARREGTSPSSQVRAPSMDSRASATTSLPLARRPSGWSIEISLSVNLRLRPPRQSAPLGVPEQLCLKFSSRLAQALAVRPSPEIEVVKLNHIVLPTAHTADLVSPRRLL